MSAEGCSAEGCHKTVSRRCSRDGFLRKSSICCAQNYNYFNTTDGANSTMIPNTITLISIYNTIFLCVNSQYRLTHVAYAVPQPDAYGGSHIEVAGGTFNECKCLDNGGFLYARAGSEVTITGGNITNNLAVKRGAGVSPTLLFSTNHFSTQLYAVSVLSSFISVPKLLRTFS